MAASRTRRRRDVFTPEKLTDEHRLMAQTTEEFVDDEVLPELDASREGLGAGAALDPALRRARAARHRVPEEYGGLDLDKASSLVVVERIARSASFATTFGGQANLVHPAARAVRHRRAEGSSTCRGWSTGEMVGAYALSESGSGSDALAARTRAMKQPDGSWLLNGEKMWITNGGFADLIIVFAKVDGEQFTAFIVERAFPASAPARKSTRWACTARRRRRSCCRTRGCRPATCSARSAGATRSRSTR